MKAQLNTLYTGYLCSKDINKQILLQAVKDCGGVEAEKRKRNHGRIYMKLLEGSLKMSNNRNKL